MASNLFAEVVETPAARTLRQRVERGGVLSCEGVARSAQPFFAGLLREMFPHRPVVVVTASLKTQEMVQQDLETWLAVRREGRVKDQAEAGPGREAESAREEEAHQGCGRREAVVGPPAARSDERPARGPAPMAPSAGRRPLPAGPLFYPAWEILPHEAKLPHADVISERLETLVALLDPCPITNAEPAIITTSVIALLQRTFPPNYLRAHTRRLVRGETLDPLDLIEWLEDQGYAPEAQVTQKGELAWRGGILDVYPLSSPWPVRLEFFGNELDSLRCFDPLTQISRQEIQAISLPPAGELGLLKRLLAAEAESPPPGVGDDQDGARRRPGESSGANTPRAGDATGAADEVTGTRRPPGTPLSRATLLDYLPRDTLVALFEPAELAEHAALYLEQIPSPNPLVMSWAELRERLTRGGFTLLEISEGPATVALAAAELSAERADARACGDAKPTAAAAGTAALATPPSPLVDPCAPPGAAPSPACRSPSAAGDPVAVCEAAAGNNSRWPAAAADTPDHWAIQAAQPASSTPQFAALDAFRPLAERAPEPHIAEAQRREFFNQIHRWLRQGYAVHVFCNNAGERQRFVEIWNDYGLGQRPEAAGEDLAASNVGFEASGRGSDPGGDQTNDRVTGRKPSDSASPGPDLASRASALRPGIGAPWTARLCPRLGTLARGFLCDEAKLVVVTDAEIFGRYRIQRPRRLKSPHAVAARSLLDINFAELEEGDYVVHLEHGIGRYLGLQRLAPRPPPASSTSQTALGTPGGTERAAAKQTDEGLEYLVIEFAPSQPGETPPKLYVPVTEAHLVGKYVGAGKARPPLHTLGGRRWAKAKAQAADAVRDLAAEFLSIQAAREALPGHAFAADTPWQREFESAFLYEETPDQLRAIIETKADMEKPRPMDRLICGDVAFGKTEVAIRAAFKAVMDGKQVAVLVPTTVLAQQHFNTFRERMADYPVRIEVLSRFRSRREQQRVVRELAAGAVDIVIGTHRLVQGDILFKDLGLVIIDEEQRFGVLQKEKFKQMRRLVDVLTLSATPIPRTLYLALTGARDMSTIETPPHDRLPVETIVAAYDERLIRDAIQRELNRGGQVFFLHNRVQTIDRMATKLQSLVPRARIVVGHGQMPSDDLEAVMTRFVNGEADVLLSTTIIESGLDIPNANTIIVDRADRFGLSDLYQLRGRVGRYKHQAYAYLLIPRHAGLLSDARKRLSAVKQYSRLGSGFKIALRDLELRGAGNLLGPEQSGHITAVGFELYCQLLKQSIASLKGQPIKPRVQVEVRLDFLTLGPADAAAAQHSRPETPRLDAADALRIEVPREVAARVTDPADLSGADPAPRRFPGPPAAKRRPPVAAAYLPLRYVPEPHHRIELYRKLAQATDRSALVSLRAELRDRFGPPPAPVELLLQLADLKLVAGERGVTAIEVEDDKLKLTRHNDFIMAGGKFPRLTQRAAKARLSEIKKLLLAL